MFRKKDLTEKPSCHVRPLVVDHEEAASVRRNLPPGWGLGAVPSRSGVTTSCSAGDSDVSGIFSPSSCGSYSVCISHRVSSPGLALTMRSASACCSAGLSAHHQIRGQRIRLRPRGFEFHLGRFDILRFLGQIVQHTQQDRPGLVLRGKLLGVFQLGGDPGMLQACPKPGKSALVNNNRGCSLRARAQSAETVTSPIVMVSSARLVTGCQRTRQRQGLL